MILFDIGEFAHHGPEDFFIAMMTFIGAFIIMFQVNPDIGVYCFVFTPLLIWLVTLLQQ